MAYLWSGRIADARARGSALRRAIPTRRSRSRSRTCSTRSSRSGLPPIVTTVAEPSAPSRAAQLRLLARAARQADATAKLRYGLALWQLWRRVSAERQFDAAAKLAPNDPVAQDGGRGRRVHEAGAGSGVRPARAADGRVPARGRRPFPPRDPARLDAAACESAQTIRDRDCRRAPVRLCERRREQFVAALRQHGTK